MISSEMYALLKQIPILPNVMPYFKLYELNLFQEKTIKSLLIEASRVKYVGFYGREGDEDYYLTENGKVAIEEFEKKEFEAEMSKNALKVSISSKRIAIVSAVIAALSLILSGITLVIQFVQ